MTVATEEHTAPRLSTGRKPISKDSKNDSLGNQALNDALILIVGCWAVIALIWYSLRNSNI